MFTSEEPPPDSTQGGVLFGDRIDVRFTGNYPLNGEMQEETDAEQQFFYRWQGWSGPEKAKVNISNDVLEWGAGDFQTLDKIAARTQPGSALEETGESLPPQAALTHPTETNKVKISSPAGLHSNTMTGIPRGGFNAIEVPSTIDINNPLAMWKTLPYQEIDYSNVANRHAAAMAGVAQALRRPGESLRKTAARVVRFLQSIPYSFEFSNAANCQSPTGMLAENRGDCDTKATALSSIMINCGVRTVVLMAGGHNIRHAFSGIAIPVETGDRTIDFEGVRYVVVDATGPAQYKLGQVPSWRGTDVNIDDLTVIPIALPVNTGWDGKPIVLPPRDMPGS